MGRTITIPLNEETKTFYKEMFLARKLKDWVDIYSVNYKHENGKSLSEDEILKQIGHKDKAKKYLTASAYNEYIENYDSIFVVSKEVSNV